jgi:hypothetical protein
MTMLLTVPKLALVPGLGTRVDSAPMELVCDGVIHLQHAKISGEEQTAKKKRREGRKVRVTVPSRKSPI